MFVKITSLKFTFHIVQISCNSFRLLSFFLSSTIQLLVWKKLRYYCLFLKKKGSIFAQDEEFIKYATDRLIDTTGNFYVNVQSTGSVVGQQPFGGARLSGKFKVLYHLKKTNNETIAFLFSCLCQ